MPNMTSYLTNDFPTNLTINIGARYSFKNYEKIIEWCDSEIKYYQQIGAPHIGNQFNQHIRVPLTQKFNQNRASEISWEDFNKELKTLIEKNFNNNRFISSRSKKGKFLIRLHDKNPKLISGALSYYQQKTQRSNDQRDQTNGMFAAYLFDNDIEPDFEDEKSKYEDFYSEITKQKDELYAEIKKVKDENHSINKELISLKKAITKEFDTEFDRHKTKMEDTEKFYDSELAVKKAVDYWAKKAQTHKFYSLIFGAASVILMLATLCSIINFGKYIIGLNIDEPNGIGEKLLTQSGALQIWVYAFFIGALTIIVWIIRLLVKVFLSNLHLLSDAKERETMIMTYLAFEREEQVLEKDDKNLILPSIFRVSSNGIIKEDSSPNPIMNFFTKNTGE